MNNGTSRREEFSPHEISRVVARYRSSGLSVSQFAQQQGMSPGRLHYWVYQKDKRKPQRSLGWDLPQPVFQEVKVSPVLPGVAHWSAEVGLPGGIAVRFNQAASAEWIGAVVQALRRPC
jgi:hypothetical protein